MEDDLPPVFQSGCKSYSVYAEFNDQCAIGFIVKSEERYDLLQMVDGHWKRSYFSFSWNEKLKSIRENCSHKSCEVGSTNGFQCSHKIRNCLTISTDLYDNYFVILCRKFKYFPFVRQNWHFVLHFLCRFSQ